MRIAIIGGGITGLAAAYELTKRGHAVTVFEQEKTVGGLAVGYKKPNWDWSLEKFYHHLFANDQETFSLLDELGLSHKLIIKRPVTANLVSTIQNEFTAIPFDSPLHLLTFPGLSLADKLRTGALAAFCKVYPFWQTLEGITAKKFFTAVGGKRAWRIIWEPLMTGKFGHFDNSIAASWLWARIHKRTPRLCYIDGGFQTLTNALAKIISKQGGTINVQYPISSIQLKKNSNYWKFEIGNLKFDKVLITVPASVAHNLLPIIHKSPTIDHLSIPHLHAQMLILETKEPILRNVYWLNITDRTFPFLAVVAHTNFIDKKYYGNRHITYIGNYLPDGHPYLSLSKQKLFGLFLPFIMRINHSFHWSDSSDWSDLFIGYNAQPVHQLHYSRRAPKFETGIPNVFLANMDSIFPWDRGTNYAIDLGQKAAITIAGE
jgi:protoporphyrinogen oxidase